VNDAFWVDIRDGIQKLAEQIETQLGVEINGLVRFVRIVIEDQVVALLEPLAERAIAQFHLDVQNHLVRHDQGVVVDETKVYGCWFWTVIYVHVHVLLKENNKSSACSRAHPTPVLTFGCDEELFVKLMSTFAFIGFWKKPTPLLSFVFCSSALVSILLISLCFIVAFVLQLISKLARCLVLLKELVSVSGFASSHVWPSGTRLSSIQQLW
jgi:hypothetical protein